MSDAKLRDLERRWRASGSDRDLGRWLGARVQAGTLPRSVVELMALLGNGGARQVVEVEPARIPRGSLLRGREWIQYVPAELWTMERQALCVRCATAVAEASLELWEELFPDDARPREALAVARRWLEDRDAISPEQVRRGVEEAEHAWRVRLNEGIGQVGAAAAAAAAARATFTPGYLILCTSRGPLYYVALSPVYAELAMTSAGRDGARRVREVLGLEVAGWVLAQAS